jgi:phosphopantothenoylcysteine decarboxylase / phosphopantothenate---cysteine ligase
MATTAAGGATARRPRPPWQGRRVLLGVGGGISAYKVAQLARDLTERGAAVDVILTRAAERFVGALTFEALTGRPVAQDILAVGNALAHIRLARDADVVCVAPATADLIARAATGQADDMLTAVLLATRAPVLICPAMNDRMWSHPRTDENVRRLEAIGCKIVGPAIGPLAFGEGEGPGRMEEPATILEHVGRALAGTTPFSGRSIVVSAGPTREPIDPIRFLSNRSSGRMGYAVAAAAWRRGADVTLISGPTMLEPPHGPTFVSVATAAEMQAAVHEAVVAADALVMSAAVADFRPANVHAGKIRKEHAPDAIQLEPAPDVLRGLLDLRPSGLAVVGFALETEAGLTSARRKLESKALHMIVLNNALAPGAGFEVTTNQVTIIDRDGGEAQLPLMPKDDVAEAILDRLVRWLPQRP